MPSPFTSPAALTESPELSPAAAPLITTPRTSVAVAMLESSIGAIVSEPSIVIVTVAVSVPNAPSNNV